MAVAGGAMAGCAKRPPEKLLVAVSGYLTMAPLHLANEDNYFGKAGLDVQLERLGSSVALAPLSAGKVDISFMTISAAMVNAIVRGAKIRVAAGREVAKPDCGDMGALLIRKKSFPGGFSYAKLKGKRVGLSARSASMQSFWVDQMLESAGLTMQDIKAVNISNAEEIPALGQGQIDAAANSVSLEVLPARWADDIDRVSVQSHIAPNLQYSFILFGARLLDGDPALGARFLAAYLHAVKDYVGGKTPKFVRAYAESNSLNYETLIRQCRATMAEDGAIDVKSIQRYVDWAHKKGFVDRIVDAQTLVDTRFVEASRKYS